MLTKCIYYLRKKFFETKTLQNHDKRLDSKFSKKRAKLARAELARAHRKRGNRNFRKDFPSKRSGLLISFWNLRRTEQTYNKIKINISFLVKITMAEEKILENHNVNTTEHEMKTQGCHLKEIKKKFLNDSAHMLIIFRNSLLFPNLIKNFDRFTNRDFLKIINLMHRLEKKTIYVHVRTFQDRHGVVRSLKVSTYFHVFTEEF